MLLNVVNKRAGEPQKLIVLLTIIIGKKMKGAPWSENIPHLFNKNFSFS